MAKHSLTNNAVVEKALIIPGILARRCCLGQLYTVVMPKCIAYAQGLVNGIRFITLWRCYVLF
jgi:hypothetical protein